MEDTALQARVLALTREHGPRVYSIARRYARSPADTEDLMQEIWTRVIEILPRKNPDSPPGGWITILATNVGREWSRNRYRWTDFKERAFRFFSIEQETEHAGKNRPRLRNSAEERVWRTVDALPELQRDVVILRVFEGMSTAEAARVIERSEGTVKASLHRGLQTLRAKLSDLESLWERGDL
ncbi:MAG TPA: sigma-70 family RNA polymerase sigma factor [Longimicrobiales bacterium]|nr:sigma-70 family RNA polymerase sigma factor [Longimicrobiales bacterium]